MIRLNMLLGLLKEKVTVSYVVLLAIMAVNTYQTERMLDSQEHLTRTATTEYAYDVIAYGLRNLATEAEIVAQVKKWKEMEWGAQVGALITICDNDPRRFDVLMTEPTKRKVCRIAR